MFGRLPRPEQATRRTAVQSPESLSLKAGGGGGGGSRVTVSGTASMGILGGEWVADRNPTLDRNAAPELVQIEGGEVIAGQSEYEFHTDIDVTFTMSGQTDTGLTFGANIDLDESDGDGTEGASNAFDNRTQGGEDIFISGGFGTLTMGDTDGAPDWALTEIAIGGSLGDVQTTHAGCFGNQLGDTANGGQIARYDYSFGDFAVGLSANIDDDGGDGVMAVGAKYNASLPAMELGIGVGYSQLGHERNKEDDAIGVSLDANFNNGFRAILNWVDMGDANDYSGYDAAGSRASAGEQYIGIGLGYSVDDWTIAANWGQLSEDIPGNDDPEQSGYALVVNYNLGGGAEVQFGYSKASCGENETVTDHADCTGGTVHLRGVDGDRISIGVAMSF